MLHLVKTRKLGYAAGLLLAVGASPMAGTMSLEWDGVPGALGYKIYHGSSPSDYTEVQTVPGAATQAELTGVANCQEHYVAVKAYNYQSESTVFSNEISGWAKPELHSVTPSVAEQGAQVTIDIVGQNFKPGAQLTLNPASVPTDINGDPLIRLESYSVSHCTQIQALISVEPMTAGGRAMEVGAIALAFDVVNPGTVCGANALTFTVSLRPERLDINRSDSSTRDRVDGKDLIWLSYAHGASEGEPRYSADADLNGDGIVDGEDLASLGTGFGKCWNGSGWSSSACP